MNEFTKINRDETLRETISHGSEEYPLRYYEEDIWQFDFHLIDWHWHPEVELVTMESGEAEILAGSRHLTLHAGQALLINAQVIHRFSSKGHAVIPNIVFSPALLAPPNSLIDRKYLQPVLNSAQECLVFSPDDDAHLPALRIIREIFACQRADSPSEIRTVALLMTLWEQICHLIQQPGTTVRSARQAQLQIMMHFIHSHFAQEVTLDDIAKSIAVSKSSALNIFKECLHTSPIRYLLTYRLKRAARMLVNTESTVMTIAQACGFENVGYFCRQFKKLFGMTPREYRKTRIRG